MMTGYNDTDADSATTHLITGEFKGNEHPEECLKFWYAIGVSNPYLGNSLTHLILKTKLMSLQKSVKTKATNVIFVEKFSIRMQNQPKSSEYKDTLKLIWKDYLTHA